MRRITSINNAIKYFSAYTRVETRKDSKGNEYRVYIPPKGFKSLTVYENIFDTRGRLVGVLSQKYESWQWRNYSHILCRDKDKISKIVLCYEK